MRPIRDEEIIMAMAAAIAGPAYKTPREFHIGAARKAFGVLNRPEFLEDVPVWSDCAVCGVPIFQHDAWSHQGGTPPQDHAATPCAVPASKPFDTTTDANKGVEQ